jgi:hypothetical protein
VGRRPRLAACPISRCRRCRAGRRHCPSIEVDAVGPSHRSVRSRAWS